MSQPEKAIKIESASLTDRGLNERRPLNEDAFLVDSERRIFAVADGVGGAEAGEVASQTAIEVLDEAFRHQIDGADIEDLMELAIQRANASIHQMAREHARFSMMATTIVALHLRGTHATFGHVGDSRLYRLSPDGELILETEDHSVVEEEVRAGRMTREEAANHPSKNVISRALGAEDAVEVDMRTMEVEDGTEFLLCTDGITRHISDGEIRQLLIANDDSEAVCAELKERCYERGAEDNLTAVVVRVGNRITAEQRMGELEPTIMPEAELAKTLDSIPVETIVSEPPARESPIAPSRIAFPGPAPSASGDPAPTTRVITTTPLRVADPAPRGSSSGVVRFLGLLFVLAVVAGAFYAGTRYKGRIPFISPATEAVSQVAPAPVAIEDPMLKFEKTRREVDRAPAEWLTGEMQRDLATQGIKTPLESASPEFLYLYGRASLLSGNVEEAGKAFEAAIARADLNPSVNSTIKKEATLGLAALTLKTYKDREQALKHYDDMLAKPTTPNSP